MAKAGRGERPTDRTGNGGERNHRRHCGDAALGAACSDAALAPPVQVRSPGDIIMRLPGGRGGSVFSAFTSTLSTFGASILGSIFGSIFGSILGASALGEVSSWSGAMVGDSAMTGSDVKSVRAPDAGLTEPVSALVGSLCCSLTAKVSRID